MKKTILLLFSVAVLAGCNETKPGHDAADATASAENFSENVYGASFAEKNIITTADLQSAVAGKDSLQATVTGEIASSCQAKGCWMDVKLADNSTMKVTFRDYGFFLPVEDLEGKTAVFSGIAKREVISVEDQRHYAQDAGKSESEIQAITAPREELRFVADGVVLK